ncbi:MAG: peptidylprolyl isomerase [Planctomycetes bacterium]|nr:peptidylprolyl isomerase [Planctomycetota bacterium]MBI3845102.1 peptidylprolyl isomerase [Planctomycetota bacterium]
MVRHVRSSLFAASRQTIAAFAFPHPRVRGGHGNMIPVTVTRRSFIVLAAALSLAVGCGRESAAPSETEQKKDEPPPVPFQQRPPLPETLPKKPDKEPDHVWVQHILISFAGRLPKETRTKEEARELAIEVLARARGGENFDQLVMRYTQDQRPGKYWLANKGVQPDKSKQEFVRDKINPALSIGFSLSPGNIDLVNFDPDTNNAGYDIVKRLQ